MGFFGVSSRRRRSGSEDPLEGLPALEKAALYDLLPVMMRHLHDTALAEPQLFLRSEQDELVLMAVEHLLATVRSGGGQEDLSVLCRGSSPHVWASVVNTLLATDPTGSLVPPQISKALMACNGSSQEEMSSALKLALKPVVRHRYNLLGHLCRLWGACASPNERLAYKFGPLVLLPRPDLAENAAERKEFKKLCSHSGAMADVLQFMVTHAGLVFDDLAPLGPSEKAAGSVGAALHEDSTTAALRAQVLYDLEAEEPEDLQLRQASWTHHVLPPVS